MGFFFIEDWSEVCNPDDVALRKDMSNAEFWEYNARVLIFLALLLAIVASFYFLDRRWKKRQHALTKKTCVSMESHEYALHLVRHFMPSIKVEKYQFRGMQPKSMRMDIDFDNLSLKLRSGATILKGVTGSFKGGRMCAIMGPSGAGKTTFMNVLCGKATYGKMGGDIFINGEKGEITKFKSLTGFVPQDDIVHEDLTVREQIQFSAELRNLSCTSKQQLENLTMDVLHVMQIDNIQNSIVGGVAERGISGGQRKRVSIGLEIAAQPTVLFLDEPTSGLDSTSSLTVALSLKKLCQLGMSSIMVIHQPRYSLFTLFDDVLFLGKGGQTVYLGPSLGARPYFEQLGFAMKSNENPSDWFMDIISGEMANEVDPNFKKEALFGAWEQLKDTVTKSHSGSEVRKRSRDVGPMDDSVILNQELLEEWERTDTNRDGVLQEDELDNLLRHCAPFVPDRAVVHQLFLRMAGEGAEYVSKSQFIDYLAGLRGDVAMDRLIGHELAPAPTLLNSRFCFAAGAPGSPKRLEFKATLDSTEGHVSRSAVDLVERNATGDLEEPKDVILQGKSLGFWRQLCVLMKRRRIQWWRMSRARNVFLLVLGVGAITLALIDRFVLQSEPWEASTFVNTHTSVALLLSIFSLQIFGNDQAIFWRESASGVNIAAFYLARVSLNTFDWVLLTGVFASLYFVITQPLVPFFYYLAPFLLVGYAASGWGYVVSTVLPPRHGPFVVSLVIFVICGLLGTPANLQKFLVGGALEGITSSLSITRWSVGLSVHLLIECTHPKPEDPIKDYILDMNNVYKQGVWAIGAWGTGIVAIVCMGLALRVLALLGLVLSNRDKRV